MSKSANGPRSGALSSQSQSQASVIRPLNNDIARVYTHLHPAVVLSTYYLLFPGIVADPVQSLTALLVPIALLQTLYLVACIPAAGSVAGPGRAATGKSSSLRKTQDNVLVGMASRVVPALLSLILSIVIGTPILAITLVLFGAPFTTHIAHTLLCASHMTVLAGFPLVYVHGIDTTRWRQAVALMLPLDEVYGAAFGTLIGAWIGAIPIPLDWDREWQKWPITIVSGAYVGWAVGRTVGGLVFRGKVMELGP